MKIVAIISQKGGAGKTTLAVHLATAAASAGHTAAIIDLDPQATAASWGDRRATGAPEVISGQAARLPALVNAARENGADFLVLDTAPNADQVVSLAARAADGTSAGSDIHASREFREHLARVLVRRGLEESAARV